MKRTAVLFVSGIAIFAIFAVGCSSTDGLPDVLDADEHDLRGDPRGQGANSADELALAEAKTGAVEMQLTKPGGPAAGPSPDPWERGGDSAGPSPDPWKMEPSRSAPGDSDRR